MILYMADWWRRGWRCLSIDITVDSSKVGTSTLAAASINFLHFSERKSLLSHVNSCIINPLLPTLREIVIMQHSPTCPHRTLGKQCHFDTQGTTKAELAKTLEVTGRQCQNAWDCIHTVLVLVPKQINSRLHQRALH